MIGGHPREGNFLLSANQGTVSLHELGVPTYCVYTLSINCQYFYGIRELLRGEGVYSTIYVHDALNVAVMNESIILDEFRRNTSWSLRCKSINVSGTVSSCGSVRLEADSDLYVHPYSTIEAGTDAILILNNCHNYEMCRGIIANKRSPTVGFFRNILNITEISNNMLNIHCATIKAGRMVSIVSNNGINIHCAKQGDMVK